jgi:hypothetical protein
VRIGCDRDLPSGVFDRCNAVVRKRYWPRPPLPGGFGFPLGFVVGIVAVVIAVAAGAAGHPGLSVSLLASVVAGLSAVTTPSAGLATAAVCWFLHDGFVLGRRGELVFTPQSAQAAVVLVATAVITLLIAAAVRMGRARGVLAQLTSSIPAQRGAAENGGQDIVLR